MQKDKLNKDELKGYTKAFKKYAGYSLSEQEYNEKLKQLEQYPFCIKIKKPKQRR